MMRIKKVCKVCAQTKIETDFYLCSSARDNRDGTCKECRKECRKKSISLKQKYYEYDKCCKCGSSKKSSRSPYCPPCFKVKHLESKVIKNLRIKNRSLLVKFVDRIENRNGLASINEMFVELIGFHRLYGKDSDINNLPVNEQIYEMYQHLKKLVKKKRNEYDVKGNTK